MLKTITLIYGGLSYFVGVAGLASIIAVMGRFMPYGYLWGEENFAMNAIFWNTLLVALWGFVHSYMARPSFKAKITKVIPEPAERATYVLVAGVMSILLTGFWMHIPGTVWIIKSGSAVYLLLGVFWFGWALTFAATFAINHFDLFGLRQVYLNFKNQPRPPLKFVKRAMYKYIRHPIQTGVMIGIWATPVMTNTQLVLTLGFTAYIFIGLWFEERDLIREHGQDYLDYKQEAGKLLPKFGKKNSGNKQDNYAAQ